MKAALLERGEKARAYLQAQGIDEEHKTKLTKEVEQFHIQVKVEITENNTND